MEVRQTAVHRAFELAKSGKFGSVTQIDRRLHAEGYPAGHLEGRSVRRQIRALIAEARKTHKALHLNEHQANRLHPDLQPRVGKPTTAAVQISLRLFGVVTIRGRR
jgi:hypothetical protein